MRIRGKVFLAGGLFLAVFLLAVFFRGGRLLSVQSGSMAPSIPVGSLLLVFPCSYEEVREGDVVTCCLADGKTMVTHRVAERLEGIRSLLLKGDANEEPDIVPVPASRIRGRVVFSLPYLGYALLWAGTRKGKGLLLGLAGLLILLGPLSRLEERKVARV